MTPEVRQPLHDSRIKTWFEISALAVGIALGVVSLATQFAPSRALTADVLEVRSPLPPEFEESLRSLPTRLNKYILEAKKEADKNIPQASITAPLIEQQAKHEVEGLFWPTTLSDRMLVCTLRNNGSVPLESVQVTFKYWHEGSEVLLQHVGGEKRRIKTSGIVDVGDMRPGGEAELHAWGLITSLASPENVLLTHKGGRGVVRRVIPVPSFVSTEGGVWLSYRVAFNLLIAGLITTGAVIGGRKTVRMWRERRKTGGAA